MDPVVLVQTLIGVLLGCAVMAAGLLTWHLSRPQTLRDDRGEKPTLNPAVAAVLSVLRSSAVVINSDDEVIKASAPAYALGLVRGNQLVAEELMAMVRSVRRDGQIRETELAMERPHLPTRYVTARVAPLNSRLLVALVEDRTAERRLEEIRRDFVANVSHELKTPIGAIRVLAEAMGEAAEDPEAVRTFSKRVTKESERLSRLVQQIIQLSRLQDDNPLDTPVPVALDEVLETAVDTCAIDAESKGVDVRIIGERSLQVPGNRDQLVTAVANLVANAVSYSEPESTVVVETRAHSFEVDINVIDRGIGIAAEELDRIFERFYRVDPARHRSTGGTGLGLSIVKHIAATHGGDVKVRSIEGEGSTFSLTLPLAPHIEESN